MTAGLPVEGPALLLGIDRVMSRGQSVVNTLGGGPIVVAKWDGGFDERAWAEADQRRRMLPREAVLPTPTVTVEAGA